MKFLPVPRRSWKQQQVTVLPWNMMDKWETENQNVRPLPLGGKEMAGIPMFTGTWQSRPE